MKGIRDGWPRRIAPYGAYFLLPFLTAIYPVLFHYGNNAGILSLPALFRQIPLLLAVSLVVYGLGLAVFRRPAQAANAAFLFLLFFHTYGIFFDQLRLWDRIRIEHYTLLAGFLLLAGYAAWGIGRISGNKAETLWQGLCLVIGVLIAANLIKIVPEEINKQRIRSQKAEQAAAQSAAAPETYPDIYYLVFDEMVGFNALRTYWHYDAVSGFEDFLRERDFYIAQSSHSSTIYTFYELASRMNYREFPLELDAPTKYWGEYLASIGNNRVMQYLKSLGYQTIVFDELPIGFLPFEADIVYAGAPEEMLTWNSMFDGFGMLILGNTMVKPFLGLVKENDPSVLAHIRTMHFTVEQIAQTEVPSPKFVYVHLLTPHVPFVFDADGVAVAPENRENWDYYLGQYLYTVQIAQNMIDAILDADGSPGGAVIILQSDHGARNMKFQSDTVILENFPESYTTLLVNALRLPGCDTSVLTQDMDPFNTFPIIFNCYFDARIPLR